MKFQEKNLIEVRPSELHGMGVFARRSIAPATRIIEYGGDRIAWDTAQDEPDGIICLFSVGRNLVVDGRKNGNEARFINHSCNPNCEAVLEKGRVFIDAIRSIRKGEELLYDYSLELGRRPTRSDRLHYACRCGAPRCRGTMLDLSRCVRKSAD